ncbi:hypothetical protein [Natrinema soli]|uniref:BZIP domain-containing protein n=1 Tax=Natrinema soli TaxID=1930624 RepID=A0ABD5SLX9_9EURY|nr:hypothetical protein [Natrinema soli]
MSTKTPTDAPTNHELANDLRELRARVSTVETENKELRKANKKKDERIDELEDRVEELQKANKKKDERIDELEGRVEELETDIDDLGDEQDRKHARFDAATDLNDNRLNELMARELEKGAHLPEEIVIEFDLPIKEGRLEKIQKDNGTYYRLPESEDPLARGGSTNLAHGDLLPIQQLAQMDGDMLDRTAKTKGDYLAAKLWQARDSEVDNPWKNGCKGVQEYIDASEMKHWIRRELGRGAVDDAYAKKLVSRTIGAMKDLTKDRIVITKTKSGRSGVTSKERRVKIMDEVEIPGETTQKDDADGTSDVHG